MKSALRVLHIELTSPAGLAVGLLSVAVALAAGLLPTPPVTGPSWSAAFNQALTGLLGLAPVSAGAVAWLVQDYQRRGIARLAASSPRGPAGGALPRVGAVLVWTLLGYLVLLASYAARTAHRGLPGGPPLLLVLLAACFLAASTALGWAVGAVTTARAAAPLLAIALFAGAYAGSYGEDWTGRLVPVDRVAMYRTFLQPHVGLVLGQVALLVALAALALTVPLSAGAGRRWTGFSAALVLTGALLVLSQTDPDPTEIRGAPADPACARGGRIMVCLRPENADLLPASTAALAATATALAPYVPVPTRYSEPGIDRRVERGPGVFVPPPVADDPLAFRAAALAAIVPPPCPRRAADASATMAYGDVLIWADARINGMAGVPRYALERFARILAESPPRQREWVHRHLVAACS